MAMLCPVCKTDELATEDVGEGLASLRCQTCSGNWLPSYVYWKWRQRQGAGAPPPPEPVKAAARGQEPKGVKFCPECRTILARYRVRAEVPFGVDRCGNCAGIWFDQGEWQVLKERGLHRDLDFIFNSAWQAKVRHAESEAREEVALRKLLGEADYAEARRIKDWMSRHPRRRELQFFLGPG